MFTSYQHDPNDPTSLSHNDVKCIFKDSDGIYWIGTEGGGPNKFDKKSGKFTSFKNDKNDSLGLSYAYIFSICEGHQGFLWIGTLDGLGRYDGYEMLVFRHHQEDPCSLVGRNLLCDFKRTRCRFDSPLQVGQLGTVA